MSEGLTLYFILAIEKQSVLNALTRHFNCADDAVPDGDYKVTVQVSGKDEEWRVRVVGKELDMHPGKWGAEGHTKIPMSKKGFDVTFTTGVKVEFDESVFTQEKRDEFRANFYQFDEDNELEEHAQHVAQLVARDMVLTSHGQAYAIIRFLEGYGYILMDDDPEADILAAGHEWSGIRYRFDDSDYETEIDSEYTPIG